ncbi:FMN reductase (NADPH) [Paenibacillus phyllosphaerae]|uniref:FMN reductase (NADPH) n=1 Tax=Paenibacillus phyllosphaerae TaxID=274593 RepID=A0A7W5B5K5_9BACL|nr:oxygen-insensitive NADPH nitroreductase [Paenibacillus phyllosphaerae]MBB3114788.1 FMN reductase (NADPH) [Paenibacillus phyllosphaerae]
MSTTGDNEVIRTLLAHRSIRKFKPDPVTDEQLNLIVAAAQAASTSSNIQAYTVIGITDPERRQRFAELTGNQRHVAECPLFLIWCADLHRLELAVQGQGEQEMHQNMETLLLATVDASLAAQNAAVAAESLGLGIVYIGGIRNNPDAVVTELGLPSLSYPLFGMCVGVPDQSPDKRPRLPLEAVYAHDAYPSDAKLKEQVEKYDDELSGYYAVRSGGARTSNWSIEMASRLKENNLRGHMAEHLTKQGFKLK